ncbi:MAG: hypothetical protein FD167_313 [bacterium]|nr:MAG: hypothetical protein FD167_313 [bacterium]
MSEVRRQLSMYVPEGAGKEIEEVRKVVDPIQRSLIPAHITLCREDEIREVWKLKDRLSNIAIKPIRLSFGKAEIFSGHGLQVKCIEGEEEFGNLREYILGSKNIRNQKAHITLAHPRNPKAIGNRLGNTSRLPEIIKITFPTIYLIEQERSERWQVLERYELLG